MGLLLSPFIRWGSWGPKEVKLLSWGPELVPGRAKTWILVTWVLSISLRLFLLWLQLSEGQGSDPFQGKKRQVNTARSSVQRILGRWIEWEQQPASHTSDPLSCETWAWQNFIFPIWWNVPSNICSESVPLCYYWLCDMPAFCQPQI